MKQYFEAKLKYTKVAESGKEQRVTETFTLEAISFTDAETTMTKLGQQITKGDFVVKGIRESNVENILNLDGDKAYKAKVSVVSVDEEAGREKRITSYWLVFADDFYEAHKLVQKEAETILVPVEIESIVLTPIVELVDIELPQFSD